MSTLLHLKCIHSQLSNTNPSQKNPKHLFLITIYYPDAPTYLKLCSK